ncbi:hypothetical protein BDR06DRAFT_1015466 [Suillus hirtellus]|nr:hypothetical protein BDR06DRAFT_1015466 [Suillus hirtellus]
MPTVLASVNTEWRRVAISTSSLWTTLSIDLETLIRPHPGEMIFSFHDKPFRQLSDFMRWSGLCPLDILIDARDPASHELIRCFSPPSTETSKLYADCMPTVFLMLLRQMHRWRSLEVVSDTLEPLCSALRVLSGRTATRDGSGAPCLEFLKLKRMNDYHRAHLLQFLPPLELDSLPFSALTGTSDQDVAEQHQSGASDQDILMQIPAPFHPLPKLRHVDIFSVLLNWAGFFRTLGAGHCIQSLELSHHDFKLRSTFDLFEAILKACPLLRRLVIRDSGPVLHRPFQHHDAISLPVLEEFHFGYTNTLCMDMLLSRLDAPNLISLSIEDVATLYPLPGSSGMDTEFLVDYCATGFSKHPSAVARSSPPFPKLQRLSLRMVFASINAFRPLVTKPKLHHLSLIDTPSALAALILEVDSTTPRPVLQSIQVCPITQEEISKLQELESTRLVLPGDEGSYLPILAQAATANCYPKDTGVGW